MYVAENRWGDRIGLVVLGEELDARRDKEVLAESILGAMVAQDVSEYAAIQACIELDRSSIDGQPQITSPAARAGALIAIQRQHIYCRTILGEIIREETDGTITGEQYAKTRQTIGRVLGGEYTIVLNHEGFVCDETSGNLVPKVELIDDVSELTAGQLALVRRRRVKHFVYGAELKRNDQDGTLHLLSDTLYPRLGRVTAGVFKPLPLL